ncbi:MAG: hypothetical protein ABJN69_04095 [Hellea sp.]
MNEIKPRKESSEQSPKSLIEYNAKDNEGTKSSPSLLKPKPELNDYHPLNAPFETD